VQGLALVELPSDPGALRGVGAVGQQEVGAHDPPVLAEGGSERALGRGVLQPGDQQAGGNPAALERCGRPEEVVVVLADPVGSRAGAQDSVDGQSGRCAEAVQA
jgi:hypothetical protein